MSATKKIKTKKWGKFTFNFFVFFFKVTAVQTVHFLKSKNFAIRAISRWFILKICKNINIYKCISQNISQICFILLLKCTVIFVYHSLLALN